MKITVITSPFGELPPIAIGAVEKLYYQLAGEWVKSGNEVVFVCCGGGDDEHVGFVRIKKYNRTGSTKKDVFWDLLYSIKALLKCPKTDILLCNTFWTPALAPFFRWKYKRLVYGVHRYPKGQFWLYPFVHAFICVSTAVEAELRRQIGKKRKILTINNPVDIPHIKADRGRHGWCHSYTIVYSGRVHPEKGLDILFEAASILAQRNIDIKIKLKIIGTVELERGGGGEDYMNHLIDKARNVDIEWVGAIYAPDRLAKEMTAGHCFVYPSVAEKGETFGVAPLEAMALGMPVILSDLKCFLDFAKPGENSLQFTREEGASECLAATIERLMRNPSESQYLATNGANTAMLFSKSTIAIKYANVFTSLM